METRDKEGYSFVYYILSIHLDFQVTALNTADKISGLMGIILVGITENKEGDKYIYISGGNKLY